MIENPKLELIVKVQGMEDSDLEYGLEEALRLVREGYAHGFNSNDTGAFDFTSRELET